MHKTVNSLQLPQHSGSQNIPTLYKALTFMRSYSVNVFEIGKPFKQGAIEHSSLIHNVDIKTLC